MSKPAPFAPHVSACPICPKSVPLISLPARSQFPHVLCQTPRCIVSLSYIREQKFVFCQTWWYVCHHWQRELFYSLVLWRDCVGDFEWHSSPSTLLYLRTTRLCNHWKKFFSYDISLGTLTLFFFFTIEFLDCVELRSQANKLCDYFTTGLILELSWNLLVDSCWNARRVV